MLKKFFSWLLNWPDCDHRENDLLHEKAAMTEHQLFEAWAFGWPVPESMYGKMEAWNARHGEELMLEKNEIPGEDLVKMKILYDKHQTNKRKK